jgi:hypothetical protein
VVDRGFFFQYSLDMKNSGLLIGLGVAAAAGIGFAIWKSQQPAAGATAGLYGLGKGLVPGLAPAHAAAAGYSSRVYPHCPDACQTQAFALAQSAMHLTSLYGDDAMRTFQSMYTSARGTSAR